MNVPDHLARDLCDACHRDIGSVIPFEEDHAIETEHDLFKQLTWLRPGVRCSCPSNKPWVRANNLVFALADWVRTWPLELRLVDRSRIEWLGYLHGFDLGVSGVSFWVGAELDEDPALTLGTRVLPTALLRGDELHFTLVGERAVLKLLENTTRWTRPNR